MPPPTSIKFHGRRPRPTHIPKLRRRDVAALLLGTLLAERNAADESGDDAQWEHLDELCARAEVMIGEGC